jgi:signal transduction histidine kinase
MSENLRLQREEQSREQQGYYKEHFLNLLERGNYVLSWDIKSKDSPGIQPSNLFLDSEWFNYNDEEGLVEQIDSYVNEFNEIMYSWSNDFYSETLVYYPQLEYYIADNQSGNYLTNSYNSIDRFLIDSQETQELKKKYPFYIVFQYDEEGQLRVADYYGYEQEQIDQLLIDYQNKEIIRNQIEDIFWFQFVKQIEEPRDMTVIYASQSSEFYYHDGFRMDSDSHPVWDFNDGGFIYVTVLAALLIALAALLLPFIKPLRLEGGLLTRVPLELCLAGMASVMAFYENLLMMAWETTSGFFITQPSQTILSETTLHILDYGINFITLVIMGATLYVIVLSIRRLFEIGIRRYIKEQTITGRVCSFLVRAIKKGYQSLIDIDLTDRSNKVILRLVTVNFIILALLCSIWVFGIAVLILYSILLFVLMRKYVSDLKQKYAILLDAASKMAEGNLDVEIKEDIGLFEPLKEEFAKVQHGFKKAVEEEMKSQRMKTDLITNVSHDLKTPLTAIITYVNLLKDENITPEERASYIATLDMKSQRLKHLIEDLFEVSKASSNNITLNLIEVDIVGLIRQVLLELDDKVTQAEIELRLNLPEEKIILNLDSEKTYRIFENLIINITKYAMPHSRAYIMMEVTEHKVIVTLKNISAMELSFHTEEITERFVRGDQSRNTEGSGLGLAIVKSFVELQGGTFEILVDGDLFKAVITWMR